MDKKTKKELTFSEKLAMANSEIENTTIPSRKGDKQYAPVDERIRVFRKYFEDYTIVTDIVLNKEPESIKVNDKDIKKSAKILFETTIRNTEGRIIANGFAQEKEDDGFINKTSYVENCETSSVGRALGIFGILGGESIASYEEVVNAIANQK